jgi:hypothetical protein
VSSIVSVIKLLHFFYILFPGKVGRRYGGAVVVCVARGGGRGGAPELGEY